MFDIEASVFYAIRDGTAVDSGRICCRIVILLETEGSFSLSDKLAACMYAAPFRLICS
jgi:hypothetical protein